MLLQCDQRCGSKVDCKSIVHRRGYSVGQEHCYVWQETAHCACIPSPCAVFHVRFWSMCSVVLCPVSSVRSLCTGTPSQRKEHKEVLGFSVSLSTQGYPWIFLQEKHNLTWLDKESAFFVSLHSVSLLEKIKFRVRFFFFVPARIAALGCRR